MHGRAALGAAQQRGSQPAFTGKQRHHASKGSHREKGKWRGIFYLWGGGVPWTPDDYRACNNARAFTPTHTAGRPARGLECLVLQQRIGGWQAVRPCVAVVRVSLPA